MAFLRLDKVMVRTGLSKSTLYDMVKHGQFPPPVRLAEKAVGWVESEIGAWEESRIKASRAGSA